MKQALSAIAFSAFATAAHAGLAPIGYYRILDENTGAGAAIIRIEFYDFDPCGAACQDKYMGRSDNMKNYYECQNLCQPYFGRIVALYDKNWPFSVGQDILRMNHIDDNKDVYFKIKGRIRDPESGLIRNGAIWRDNENSPTVSVRIESGLFGWHSKTMTWEVIESKDIPPDLKKLDFQNWTPATIE